jgi:hypothetical protein
MSKKTVFEVLLLAWLGGWHRQFLFWQKQQQEILQNAINSGSFSYYVRRLAVGVIDLGYL